jgi:hypothetical protein
MQKLAPNCDEYVPGGHFEHALAPVVEYSPAGQSVHTVEEIALATLEYLPAVQSVHD